MSRLRIVLRMALIGAVILALVAVELSSRSGVLWRLVTFTYQANVLAAAYYAWTLVSPRADARDGLRGAVVLYVVAAGLIWNAVLTGHSMGYTLANVLLHVVVPVIAVADWVLISHGGRTIRWSQPFVWLVYPAVYGTVALAVLNNAGRRAPYYFLDPGSVGRGAVIVNTSLLGIGILGLGYLLAAVTRVRR